MILDADLPENLTAIPAAHGELQRVMVGILLEDTVANVSTKSEWKKAMEGGGGGESWTYSGVGSQLD